MATETIKPKDASEEAEQAQLLARRYRCEFINLHTAKIDHELFRTVPVDLMFRYHFVPLQAQNGTLEIAIADPRQIVLIDELSVLLGKKLRTKIATYSQISDLLKKTEQSQRVLEEVTEGFALDVVGDDEGADENLSIDRLTSDEGNIAPVIKLVDTTIFNALERRASDIHIEARDQELAIKYRIDGVLQYAMSPIAKEWYSAVISRIKVMSELDIAERRVPQDGRFRVRYKGRLIDFRVSIMPTIYGEDAVLRVLDKESMSEKFARLTLDVVGFADQDLAKFRRFIKEPYGMVLVTGPTGSGKTTTLYAALSEIKNDEDKIITIEDPVEYQIKGITQIPVNERKGLTFARGLRSILRHDPDKILVGEIRDQETAQIAINAALTGHLVFTTVHANNVIDVLGRFLNMGVEPYNFVSSLNCILAQRLVRVICPHCRERVTYDDAYLRESGLDLAEWRSFPFHEGRGCIECSGTGFRGRTAIHELLDLTEEIREMIVDRKSTSEIKRTAKADGMTFLRQSALDRVSGGITTLREANKVTFIEG
ncbi:MAG: type II/IV secretion system protein [Acidobacteriaceae bacterium]|nr:type II/IV secretion system protein [Acidobacteriaceae bacterium]MBV9502142.1 type II/IV secretion system protein [Acidobacteriaceae bacterium]